MKKQRHNIIGMELIGKEIKVVDATNKNLIGKEGRVVDETKNMIVVETKNREKKKIMKNNVTIITTHKDKTVKIKGALLQKRPEERIKLR